MAKPDLLNYTRGQNIEVEVGNNSLIELPPGSSPQQIMDAITQWHSSPEAGEYYDPRPKLLKPLNGGQYRIEPVNETVRDKVFNRVFDFLLNDGDGALERQKAIRRANSITMALDWLPAAGDAMLAGDVKRAFEDERFLDATVLTGMSALGVIPIVGKMGKEALNSPQIKKLGKEVVAKLNAWHGSPHKFDKFDLSKTGTGSGEAHFGSGAYLSEDKSLAEFYAQNLKPEEDFQSYIDFAALDNMIEETNPWDKKDMLETVEWYLEEQRSEVEKAVAKGKVSPKALEHYDEFSELMRTDEIADYLLDGENEAYGLIKETARETKGTPNLYEVELNLDKDGLLEWDTPIKEQPPKVQEALKSLDMDRYIGNPVDARQNKYGGDDSWFLVDDIGEWGTVSFPTKEAALAAKDEPGARLQSFIPDNETGKDLYRSLAYRAGNSEEASAILDEAGVLGIKYTGEGDAPDLVNYVVFNDKNLNIKNRNGQPISASERKQALKTFHRSPEPMLEGPVRMSPHDETQLPGFAVSKNEDSWEGFVQNRHGAETLHEVEFEGNIIKSDEYYDLRDELEKSLGTRPTDEQITEMLKAEGVDAVDMEDVIGDELIITNPDAVKSVRTTADMEQVTDIINTPSGKFYKMKDGVLYDDVDPDAASSAYDSMEELSQDFPTMEVRQADGTYRPYNDEAAQAAPTSLYYRGTNTDWPELQISTGNDHAVAGVSTARDPEYAAFHGDVVKQYEGPEGPFIDSFDLINETAQDVLSPEDLARSVDEGSGLFDQVPEELRDKYPEIDEFGFITEEALADYGKREGYVGSLFDDPFAGMDYRFFDPSLLKEVGAGPEDLKGVQEVYNTRSGKFYKLDDGRILDHPNPDLAESEYVSLQELAYDFPDTEVQQADGTFKPYNEITAQRLKNEAADQSRMMEEIEEAGPKTADDLESEFQIRMNQEIPEPVNTFKTSDGIELYEMPDGRVVDNPHPDYVDMEWESVDDLAMGDPDLVIQTRFGDRKYNDIAAQREANLGGAGAQEFINDQPSPGLVDAQNYQRALNEQNRPPLAIVPPAREVQAPGAEGFDPRFQKGIGTGPRAGEAPKLEGLTRIVSPQRFEVPEVSLADYEGRGFITHYADRTDAGRTLHGVDGEEFADVDLQGGQDFMFDNPYVWAGAEGPAKTYMRMADEVREATGQDPIWMPWRMTPTGSDFNTTTGEVMIAHASANMRPGAKRSLNAKLKKIIPGFKSIDDPETVELFRRLPRTQRDKLVQVMDTGFRERGGLSVSQARMAIADPSQVNAPQFGLQNIGEINPRGEIVESAHNTYPYAVPGQGLGRMKENIEVFDVIPEYIKAKGYDRALPEEGLRRSLEMNPISGIITPDLLKRLGL